MKKILLLLMVISMSACAVTDKPESGDDNSGGSTTDYNQLWKDRVINKSAGVSSFDRNANLTYLTEIYKFDSSLEVGRGIYKKDNLYYGVIADESFTTTLSMTRNGVSDSASINWENVKNITTATPEPEPDYNQLWKDRVASKIAGISRFDNNANLTYEGVYKFDSSLEVGRGIYKKGSLYYGVIASENFATTLSMTKIGVDNITTLIDWSDVKNITTATPEPETPWTEYSPLTGIKYDLSTIYPIDMKIINNIPHVLYQADNSPYKISMRKPLNNWEEIANNASFPSQYDGAGVQFITDDSDNLYMRTSYSGDPFLFKKSGNTWDEITRGSEKGYPENIEFHNTTPYSASAKEIGSTDRYTIYLDKNTGANTWVNLAKYETPRTLGYLQQVKIHIQDENNIYVSYYQEEGLFRRFSVLKWNGSEFLSPLDVGTPHDNIYWGTDYIIHNNKLYVIYVDEFNKVFIKNTTTGTSWQNEIELGVPTLGPGYGVIHSPKLRIHNNIMYFGVIRSTETIIYKYENNSLNTIKTIPKYASFDMEISDDNRLFFIHSQYKSGIIDIESTQL